MFYFDTSFTIPKYIKEATSDKVEAILLSLPPEQLVISQWTRVEFSSMLARRVRMQELTDEQALEIKEIRFLKKNGFLFVIKYSC